MSILSRRPVRLAAVVLALTLVGGVVLIWRLDSVVTAFAPTIEREIARATRSKVKIGKVSAALFPKIRASLDSLELVDSRAKDSVLTLNNLAASISLRQLLTGTLKITSLEFDKPNITVVRSKGGTYIEGLGDMNNSSQDREGAQPQDPTRQPTVEEPHAEQRSLSIDMERIGLTGGTVRWKDLDTQRELAVMDLSADAAVALSGDTLNVSTLNLSGKVGGSLPISLAATGVSFDLKTKNLVATSATLSPGKGTVTAKGDLAKSVQVSGEGIPLDPIIETFAAFFPRSDLIKELGFTLSSLQGTLDAATGTVTVQTIELNTPAGAVRADASHSIGSGVGSAKISADPLNLSLLSPLAARFAPTISSYNASGSVKLDQLKARWGNSITLEGLIILTDVGASLPSGYNLSKAAGRVDLEITPELQRAESPALSLVVNGTPLEAKLSIGAAPDKVSADPCSIKGFSGAATLPFKVTLSDPKQFSTQLAVAGMDLEQLLRFGAPAHADKIRGTLTDTNLKVGITLGGQSNPAVSGRIGVINGAFKGFNIAGAVLKKADSLPGVGSGLASQIPERFKPFVGSPDTAIKDLKLNLQLANQTAQITGLVLVSDFFTVTSDGSYALDSGRVSLRSQISFSPEFSAALVASAKELKAVLSADRRLQIPLLIEGTPPAISVTPDFEKVAKLGAERLVKEKAGELLEKALQKNLGGSGRGDPLKKALGGILGF